MLSSNTTPIGLAELIDEVKRELLSPSPDGDAVPLFAVEQVEVQATICVQREGNGGINIQVLSIGVGMKEENAQTVRVLLKPLLSPEELTKNLRALNPEDFHRVVQQAGKTMRGAKSRKGKRNIPQNLE